jgi:hypothetical protein
MCCRASPLFRAGNQPRPGGSIKRYCRQAGQNVGSRAQTKDHASIDREAWPYSDLARVASGHRRILRFPGERLWRRGGPRPRYGLEGGGGGGGRSRQSLRVPRTDGPFDLL